MQGRIQRGHVARARGTESRARGTGAEAAAVEALTRDGWTILGQRIQTEAGEIDIVADRDGLLALIEVKARPSLQDAAAALTRRQQDRLLAAADLLLADHPDGGRLGARFDVILVDAAGQVRRIADAFRREEPAG